MSAKEIVLRVEARGREPFEHRIAGSELVIGRSSASGLSIPDPYLSRRQARIFQSGGSWLLEDLGGRNATLLNGVPVTHPTPLAVGDLVKMSSETLLRVATAVPSGAEKRAVDSDSGAVFRNASALMERSQIFSAAPASEAALRRHHDRLQLLNEVHRALGRSVTLDELFTLILDRVFAALVPEEAVIFLKDAKGEFHRAATRRLPGIESDFLYSRSLVHEVTEKQLAALVFDASSDERFAHAQSILSSGVRSMVAAPLLDPEGCPGMIVLGSRANVRQFSEDDLELLVSLASVAALRIRNLALAEEAARKRAIEKELELARAIQMGLLPDSLPAVAGYELRARNLPSRAVSGDLYQVQLRDEGRECVLLLADVSGKGMAAALLTASLEALATGPIEVGLPADEISEKLSRRLHARTSAERYATAFVAVLDPARHVLRYANAGHNPALLVRADGQSLQLGATGLPLGLLPMASYTAEDVSLGPGDSLVIYTDGITEAANPEEEEYGIARLEEVVRRHRSQPLETFLAALDQDVEAFTRGVPFGDDRTLIVVRRSS
jgi:sigma-B regulation protein RsbU (phosphoserine phosphatase)